MDMVTFQSASTNRNVTPTRGSEKRDNGQENDAAELLSQAAARRRAQELQAQAAQQARQQRQAEQMAERANQRFSGRLVKVGDNRSIENTKEARAEVMRDKVEKAYSDSSARSQAANAMTFEQSAEPTESDSYSASPSGRAGEPIDLVV